MTTLLNLNLASKTTPPPLAGVATVVQPAKSNAPTFESLIQNAKDLGQQAGLGKDTQIKFAMLVIEGAYLGTLSLDPNKHGIGQRDGKLLAEAYVKAQQGAVTFDAKSDKSRKLISNIDKCIKLGSTPKWGRGQPMQTVQELVEHRQKLRKDPATAKKLDDAFNMLMRFATVQLRNERLLDDETRNAFAFRPVSGLKSVSEVIEGVRKTVQRLASGKLQSCDSSYDTKETQAIVAACTKILTDLAKAGK